MSKLVDAIERINFKDKQWNGELQQRYSVTIEVDYWDDYNNRLKKDKDGIVVLATSEQVS